MDLLDSKEYQEKLKQMEKAHPEYIKELGHTIFDLINTAAWQDINPLTYVTVTAFQNALLVIAKEQEAALAHEGIDA